MGGLDATTLMSDVLRGEARKLGGWEALAPCAVLLAPCSMLFCFRHASHSAEQQSRSRSCPMTTTDTKHEHGLLPDMITVRKIVDERAPRQALLALYVIRGGFRSDRRTMNRAMVHRFRRAVMR